MSFTMIVPKRMKREGVTGQIIVHKRKVWIGSVEEGELCELDTAQMRELYDALGDMLGMARRPFTRDAFMHDLVKATSPTKSVKRQSTSPGKRSVR